MANSVFLGQGDVYGPASATDGALCAFDGTTGKLIKVGSASGVFVSSITGTANQVIASAATGAVTLSLPQSIGTGSSPTFAALTLGTMTLTPSGITARFNGPIESGTGHYVLAQSFLYLGAAGTQSRLASLADGSIDVRTQAGADTGKISVNVINATGKFQLNGVDGFTGTGAYTNFTIVGGIITAAT